MRKNFENKILYLSSKLPSDFNELKLITLDKLLCDAKKLPPEATDYLEKNKDLLTQFEGLKQFNSEYYKSNIKEACKFIKAISYNDLWSFVIFHELWRNFIDKFDQNNFSTIKKINDIMSNNLINKIRNSIAHLDVDYSQKSIILKDKEYTKNFTIIEIGVMASWLLTVLIIMAHNKSLQRI